MDKTTDKIAALPPGGEFFSLEFFPLKTAMGFSNLRHAKSFELAELCQRELGLTTCLHLTCTNTSLRLIDKALDDAKALGIRNILALRGDPPRGDEYRDEDDPDDGADELRPAVDLVRYIRRLHSDYFCVGVAAYPEGHADGSHPAEQSLDNDLPYLVDKVRADADFIPDPALLRH